MSALMVDFIEEEPELKDKYDLPNFFAPREDPPWRHLAACSGSQCNQFFPPDWEDETSPEEICESQGRKDFTTIFNRQAKAVCASCPVVLEMTELRHGVKWNPCLQYALDTNERSGVWGNTTPLDRKYIRRRLKREGALT